MLATDPESEEHQHHQCPLPLMSENRFADRTVNAQFFSATNPQHAQPAPDQLGDRIEEPQAKSDIQIDQIGKADHRETEAKN